MDRKVILYIASSLDGYIAKPDGSLQWLFDSENDGDNGYYAFMESVDTTIMGRSTYNEVLNFDVPFPYTAYQNYVVTHSPIAEDSNNVIFYSGAFPELIKELKNQPGKNIFLIGGSQIIAQFLALDLIDELVLSIAPVLIGTGIPLFAGEYLEKRFKLDEVRQYKELVQLHYVTVK